MNKDKIAKELAELGQEESRLMHALIKVQKRRCKLLSEVACHADTGLEPDVAAASIAPKDDGGE
jgi:hypothetical protein